MKIRRALVVLVAVALSMAPAIRSEVASAATTWEVKSTAVVRSGTQVGLTVTFTAPSTVKGAYVLDTEIANPAGKKVAQWVETKTPTANQVFTFTYTWTPGSLGNGTYQVGQGVWTSNWATMQTWKSNTSSVSLPLNQGPPPPTTTTTTSTTAPPATTTSTTTLPTTSTTVPPSSNQWTVNSSTVVRSGTTAAVTVTFRAPSTVRGAYVLDTEIANPAGKKVAQWVETKTPLPNQVFTFTYAWTPGALGNGTYQVGLGVWTSNWATMQVWRSNTSSVALPLAAPLPTTTTTALPPTTTTTLPPTTTTTVPPTTTTTTTTTEAPTTTTTTEPPPTTTTTTTSSTTTTTTTVPPRSNPLAGNNFGGVNQNALDQASAWNTSRPEDAALMQRLGTTPTAQWFGDFNVDISNDVSSYVNSVSTGGRVPVLVAYNIVNRDCSGYSAGGAKDVDAYNVWIDRFAEAIGTQRAVVILEPDALAQMCGDAAARYQMLNNAVDELAEQPGVSTYIDGGNAHWIDAVTMSNRLERAGVAETAGFAVNVGNYFSNSESEGFGEAVSAQLGGARYVVDTARNGSGGTPGNWCNPSEATVGKAPTSATSAPHNDAYLWIAIPGNSDGSCNNGPSAGTWWALYALQLVAPWRSTL